MFNRPLVVFTLMWITTRLKNTRPKRSQASGSPSLCWDSVKKSLIFSLFPSINVVGNGLDGSSSTNCTAIRIFLHWDGNCDDQGIRSRLFQWKIHKTNSSNVIWHWSVEYKKGFSLVYIWSKLVGLQFGKCHTVRFSRFHKMWIWFGNETTSPSVSREPTLD